MKKNATALVIAILSAAALAGCAKKLPPGVLDGGRHVPPPPSEEHRVTSRVTAEPAAPVAPAPAAARLSAPAAR